MKKLRVIQIGVIHAHGISAFNSILKQEEIFDVVGFAVPESEMDESSYIIAEYRNNRGMVNITDKLTLARSLRIPGKILEEINGISANKPAVRLIVTY